MGPEAADARQWADVIAREETEGRHGLYLVAGSVRWPVLPMPLRLARSASLTQVEVGAYEVDKATGMAHVDIPDGVDAVAGIVESVERVGLELKASGTMNEAAVDYLREARQDSGRSVAYSLGIGDEERPPIWRWDVEEQRRVLTDGVLVEVVVFVDVASTRSRA